MGVILVIYKPLVQINSKIKQSDTDYSSYSNEIKAYCLLP
jgi:hypothetical protein